MTCVTLSFLISAAELMLPILSVIFQVVHEIRNYPYPQLHLLALQSLNPSRHASAVRESYEVCADLLSRHTSQHSFIIVSTVTNALDMLECNRFSYLQLLWVPDVSDGPSAFNLMTFVVI